MGLDHVRGAHQAVRAVALRDLCRASEMLSLCCNFLLYDQKQKTLNFLQEYEDFLPLLYRELGQLQSDQNEVRTKKPSHL